MNHIYTPWRLGYIKGDKSKGGCVFCKLAAQERDPLESLVVARGEHCFVVLNRYPYTFGHTIIVPCAHHSTPEDYPPETLAELTQMTNRAMRALRSIANPDGFNIGANIGAAAGASIAGHYHFHVVARWVGDANFMLPIGDTQTIAATLTDACKQMREAWQAADAD